MTSRKVAFIIGRKARYPPRTTHTMKIFYVTRELIRRGIGVDWIFPGRDTQEGEADIGRVSIPVRSPRFLSDIFFIFEVLKYCKSASVSQVYVDEWLFLHGRPERVLLLSLALRVLRIGFVFDQRDPMLDFWMATGRIRRESNGYRILKVIYDLIHRSANLTILPSSHFSDEMVKQNIPPEKVLGLFRGIDLDLFDPLKNDGRTVRRSLGIQGKFVIGWFGIMNEVRQIRDVMIPIIESVERRVPNSQVIVAGKGRLRGEFVRAKERNPQLPLTLLDFVSYQELPEYIAACDVLLCPLDTRFKFVRFALPLKIMESLAMGKPIIVTRTPATEREFKNLKGIAWAIGTTDSFLIELKNISNDSSNDRSAAREQARDPTFRKGPHAITSTIPRIVDRILKV